MQRDTVAGRLGVGQVPETIEAAGAGLDDEGAVAVSVGKKRRSAVTKEPNPERQARDALKACWDAYEER